MKKQAALILIDVQLGFHHPMWGRGSNEKLEENVAKLLSIWREHSAPIFHVQHLSRNSESPLLPGQSGVEFMNCAKPNAGEKIIQKQVNSCFIGTELEELLRSQGIERLVFAGIASDHCVSTSTRMGANLGFSCFVVADATTTFDRIDHQENRYLAKTVYAVSLASLHGEFATVIDLAEVEKYLP